MSKDLYQNFPSLPTSFVLLFSLFVILFYFFGCEKKSESPEDLTSFSGKLTCEGCHTDAETLKALATPEPPPATTGGG